MWSAISRSLPQFAPARRPHTRQRFTLERLEERSMLSAIPPLTVNTLADDPTGPIPGNTTLRDAITAADAGSTANKYVIKFAVDGTIALSAPLPDLANNIVINGPGIGNLTIQCASNAEPFSAITVDSGDIVTISRIMILGTNILNYGNLTVKDTDFINSPWAAIYANNGRVSPSTLAVTDCVFINAGGSAIEGGPQILTVTDSVFFGNNNGAISVSYYTTSTLEGDIFVDNFRETTGGAIFSAGTMTIIDSLFVDNSASVAGGAIFNDGGTMTIDSSVFIKNSATGTLGSGMYTGVGGGIASNTTSTLTVNNSEFIDNSAINGGGIYNQLGTLVTTNDLFLDNTGGDIYS